MQGVFERLGTLAVLRSIGFTIGRVRQLIVLETLLLVGAGLMVGASLGGAALLPLFLAGRAVVPWGWLAASALLTPPAERPPSRPAGARFRFARGRSDGGCFPSGLLGFRPCISW